MTPEREKELAKIISSKIVPNVRKMTYIKNYLKVIYVLLLQWQNSIKIKV